MRLQEIYQKPKTSRENPGRVFLFGKLTSTIRINLFSGRLVMKSALRILLGRFSILAMFVMISNTVFAVDSLYVDSTGNVGIGTTTPSRKLDVMGTIAVNGQAAINTNTSSGEILMGDLLSGDGMSVLSLRAGDDTRIRISADGKVGVGTRSPQTALHVDGSDPWLLITDGADGFLSHGVYGTSTHISFDDRGDLEFSSQPNDYKGTIENPTIRLRIKGSTGYVQPGIDGMQKLGTSLLRWHSVYAMNQTIQTSDERKKDQIKEIPLGLEFVKKLQPISYKWKNYSVPEVAKTSTEIRQKIQKVKKTVETRDVVLVNGRYVEKKVNKTVEVEEPVYNEYPLYDEKGKLIGKHYVPVMETRPVKEITQHAQDYRFTETHFGLSA
jgi:hypothetical protein